jgi:hypothetical protein
MKRWNSFLGIGLVGLMVGIGSVSLAACGDDDDDNATAGKGGSAGRGGSAGTPGGSGTAGTPGGSGTGGSPGGSGSGGSPGGSGSAGSAGSGGGAAVTCASPTEAFAKLGGATTFDAVTNAIIANSVKANDDGKAEVFGTDFAIGKSFEIVGTPDGQSAESLDTNLQAFLTKVYGGPDDYQGRSMEDAHEGLEITSVQYDQFVAMIVKILTTPTADGGFGLATETLTTCLAPPLLDPDFKASIVEVQ